MKRLKTWVLGGAIGRFFSYLLQYALMMSIVLVFTMFISLNSVIYFVPAIVKAVGVNYDTKWQDMVFLVLLPVTFMYGMLFLYTYKFYHFLWEKLSYFFYKKRELRRMYLYRKYLLDEKSA